MYQLLKIPISSKYYLKSYLGNFSPTVEKLYYNLNDVTPPLLNLVEKRGTLLGLHRPQNALVCPAQHSSFGLIVISHHLLLIYKPVPTYKYFHSLATVSCHLYSGLYKARLLMTKSPSLFNLIVEGSSKKALI